MSTALTMFTHHLESLSLSHFTRPFPPSQFASGIPTLFAQVHAALHYSLLRSSTLRHLSWTTLAPFDLPLHDCFVWLALTPFLGFTALPHCLSFPPCYTLRSPSGDLPGDVERPYLHLFLPGVVSASKHCELLSFLR